MVRRIQIFISIIAILSGVFVTTRPASALCNSVKCKEAAAAEEIAREKANNATSAANTLADEVERLNAEIAMYEARIEANTAAAEDLSSQIQESLDKLSLQQAALANLLVDLHFEEQPEAIMILAGSTSISDYAEKQARANSVKEQVALSAQAVKSLKQELEDQKAEVERIIADQTIQKSAIATTRAEQNQLMEKYRDDADAYAADAEEARKQKEAAIAEEIAANNSYGIKASGGNNIYPYAGNCPHDNLAYSTPWGYVCQCTSYAGFKAYDYFGVSVSGWGNAYSWDDVAASLGYRVDTNPAPHTVAVSNAGAWGHVMWVEAVNDDGTINLSEYNNAYSAASGLPGDYGYRINVSPAGLYFIHFE